MPQATNTKRKTWLDLQPPGAPEPSLLTRAQLLERVGRDADESDLRYWESIGVLPKPIRRWHNGATRALYPASYIVGIWNIRRLQANGLPLEQIRGSVWRLLALFAAKEAATEPENLIDLYLDHRPTWETPSISPTTEAGLRQLARSREELTGVPTERIEVRIIGKDGRKTVHTIAMIETDVRAGANESV